MADFKLQPNPSGSGQFTLQPPNSNNNQTITLPDDTTTLVGHDTVQTLTNKTIQGGALNMVSGGSLSGATTDFVGIPSWVKRVTIFLTSASTSGTSNNLLQLGSGSILTSGYVSACMNSRNAGTGFGSTSTTGFIFDNDSIASYVYDGTIKLINPSGNVWFFESTLIDTGGIRLPVGVGRVSLSGTLDRIRFTTLGGTNTYDGGSFSLMYEG